MGLETSSAFETTNSKTVSDLIEAETGVAFETAVNDQTLGKYGDLVVVSGAISLGVVNVFLNGAPLLYARAQTVGWTLLITEGYDVTFETMPGIASGVQKCTIVQTPAPTWSPAETSMRADSLQVRAALSLLWL